MITAGVFNLKDDATAKQEYNAIKEVIQTTKGRFTGFAAGGNTDVISRAATQLAWDTRGHFLLYCVIARVDSQPVNDKDPTVEKIVTDVMETYLNDTVIEKRTVSPPSFSPASGAPAASATGSPAK